MVVVGCDGFELELGLVSRALTFLLLVAAEWHRTTVQMSKGERRIEFQRSRWNREEV